MNNYDLNLIINWELNFGEKNYVNALNNLLIAANKNNDPRAQNSIGCMYKKGEGVELDFKEAIKWFLLAANQNDSDAQYKIGMMYYEGKGVEQDFKEAMKWYLLA